MNKVSDPISTCCMVINNYRKYAPGNIMFIRSLKVDKNALSNATIISHIQNCCGHTSFMAELLSERSDDDFSSVDCRYFLLLALMLDQDFHDNLLFKRLYGCIPILKRMMVKNLDTIWYSSGALGNIFEKASPIDPQVIVDFTICFNDLVCEHATHEKGVNIFKALMAQTVPIICVKIEHLDRLIEIGNDLPECIADVHKNVTSIMKYDKEIIECVSEDTGVELSKISPCLNIRLYDFSPDGYFTNELDNLGTILQLYDNNTESPNLVDTTGLHILQRISRCLDSQTIIEKSEGSVSMEDLEALLSKLSGTQIPIYLENCPILLQHRSFAKSARK